MLAVKFFSSSHDENQEAPWSQNPMMYKHSSSDLQYACENFLHPVASVVTDLKTILIYV